MKTLSLTFTAGQRHDVPGGELFYILATSYAVDVEYINQAGTPLNESAQDVESGYWSKPKGGFNLARITSTLAQTIKIGISRGDGGYDRVTGEVEVSKSKEFVSYPDAQLSNGIPTLLSALTTGRREFIITNLPTNAGPIRIGDLNVNATEGIYLPVNHTLVLETTAPIYAYAPALGYYVALSQTKD